NIKLTLHVPPGASPLPHVLDSLKSAAAAPPRLMFVIVKLALPVLLSVTTCGALAIPSDVDAKLTCLCDNCSEGPLTPVPVSGIICGLACVLSVKVIAPLLTPSAVGANCTLIVQFSFGRTLAPQLLVSVK